MANASTGGTLVWDKTYGGPQDDGANSVVNTTDGGYIITGYTSSYGNGNSNVWLIKTDANGNEAWNKTYGGLNDSAGHSVVQTGDGGYAVAGYSTSYGNGTMNVYLLKTDPNGHLLWNRTYDGNVSDSGGFSLAKTSDGGFVMTGFFYDNNKGGWNLTLIKTDGNGIMQWNRSYGGDIKECGHSVIQTSDGGYAITGYTKSYGIRGGDNLGGGEENLWLLKTDQNGNEQWNRTFGGIDYDDGFSILQNTDGGYTIAGTTKSYGKNNTAIQIFSDNDTARVYLIRTDSNGNLLWNKTFGGNLDTAGFSLDGSTNGGYIIAGMAFTNNSSAEILVLRTYSNGTLSWANEYGGLKDDYGYSISPSSNGGFVIAGYTQSFGKGGSDVWLLNIGDGASGNASGTAMIPGASKESPLCGSLAIFPLVISGVILSGMWVRKKK